MKPSSANLYLLISFIYLALANVLVEIQIFEIKLLITKKISALIKTRKDMHKKKFILILANKKVS